MRDVLVHQAKARAIIKVFAGRMCMCVEIMNQPWRRKDPILKSFVVVTVLRIRSQHPIVYSSRQTGPGGRLGSLIEERIGGDAQTSDGNEGVILAVGEGASGLGFKIVR